MTTIKGEVDGKPFVFEVEQDSYINSPRKDYDNLGTFWTFERDSISPDEHPYNRHYCTLSEIAIDMAMAVNSWFYDLPHRQQTISLAVKVLNQHYIILPVMLRHDEYYTDGYLSESDFDNHRLVGFIYAEKKTLREEYGRLTNKARKIIINVLQGEVEMYNQWAMGEVYSFTLSEVKTCPCCGHVSHEPIDSCCGFYGDDIRTNGMLENLSTEYRDAILAAA